MEINRLILLIATALIWIAVFMGTYQRIFQMPKWFSNPPASFELIRQQSSSARLFWIPLSLLFIINAFAALILNWRHIDTRIHIIGGIICFALTGALSGIYFVREVNAFTKIPADSLPTEQLVRRVKFWLKWTTSRNILQLLAAIFFSIAYNHL